MDNCSIHHDEEIRYLIEEECGKINGGVCFLLLTVLAGAKLIYLPPYSPDFNPIEEAFSSIKAWLRRHESLYVDPEQLQWLIHLAAASVTAEMAWGWFKDCGYIQDD